MEAAAIYHHCALHLPSFSASSKSKLGRSVFSCQEIADRPHVFPSQRVQLSPAVASIKADGDRRHRPQRKYSAQGKEPKVDQNEIPKSPGMKPSKSSDPDKIISFLKRIQSSVSKGDSAISQKNISSSYEDKPVESILEILRQSTAALSGQPQITEETKVLSQQNDQPKNELNAECTSVVHARFTRPPSNFVKRSPIPPSPSRPMEKFEIKTEYLPTTDDNLKVVKLEEMKVSELKELAKSKGMKGYSKLKKSELVHWLIRS